MRTLKNWKIFFLGLVAILSVSSIAEPRPKGGGTNNNKGGGTNNNGTGIRCADGSVTMLDVFGVTIPSDVQERFDERHEVASEVSRIFSKHGYVSSHVLHWLENYWSKFGSSEAFRQESGWDFLVDTESKKIDQFDELLSFDLPKGCEVVRVSYFNSKELKPKLNIDTYSQLSRFQRRVLELHESFYAMGVVEYGHINAVKTQRLVLALVKSFGSENTDPELFRAIEDHASAPLIDSSPFGFKSSSGLYTYLSGKGDAGCPSWIAMIETGLLSTQMIFPGIDAIWSVSLDLNGADSRSSWKTHTNGVGMGVIVSRKIEDRELKLNLSRSIDAALELRIFSSASKSYSARNSICRYELKYESPEMIRVKSRALLSTQKP